MFLDMRKCKQKVLCKTQVLASRWTPCETGSCGGGHF
eukprot:jgi/Antlo1/1602/464